MLEPFIRKMEIGADLSDDDRETLKRLICQVRPVGAAEDLVREDDRPDNAHIVLSGLACRYKMLADGGRQIMAWLVPGDLCDMHVSILGRMDHSIATLVPCQIAYIPRNVIEELTSKHPAINRALWWASLVDEATLREWLVNMGRRTADKQMAHLFCEIYVRLDSIGLVTEGSFSFPVTQVELADTLGITTVHVNRMLHQLRDAGLMTLRGKRMTIENFDRLRDFAEFNPNYLHLTKRQNGGGWANGRETPAS
jgi:CRP-like cAMP-binding protein